MSVLNCPVCQGAMREIERQGVLIDTCTQCRGVWLDRGELEKLAGAIGGSSAAAFNAAPAHDSRDVPRNRGARFKEIDDDDDDRHDGDRPRKSKTSRFMDFFD